MSGGSKEHKNGVLDMVDIFHSLKVWKNYVMPFRSDIYFDYISNMIWFRRFCINTNYFVSNGLYVSDFIEYVSIFLTTEP